MYLGLDQPTPLAIGGSSQSTAHRLMWPEPTLDRRRWLRIDQVKCYTLPRHHGSIIYHLSIRAVVHAPTTPRHHHLPPRNQSRRLKFDSRVSNRLDLHRFSEDWTGCKGRSNPRSAAIGAHRSNNLVHAPTAPRHHHPPPRNQSCRLKFDSRVSNRLAHPRCR